MNEYKFKLLELSSRTKGKGFGSTFMICVTTLQYMFDYCFHPTDEKTEDQLIQLT